MQEKKSIEKNMHYNMQQTSHYRHKKRVDNRVVTTVSFCLHSLCQLEVAFMDVFMD